MIDSSPNHQHPSSNSGSSNNSNNNNSTNNNNINNSHSNFSYSHNQNNNNIIPKISNSKSYNNINQTRLIVGGKIMSVKSPTLSASSQSESDLLGHLRKSGSVGEDVDALYHNHISVSSSNMANLRSNSTLTASSMRNTPVPLPKPPSLSTATSTRQLLQQQQQQPPALEKHGSNSSNGSSSTTTTDDVDEILNKVLIIESNNLQLQQLQQLEESVVVVQHLQPSSGAVNGNGLIVQTNNNNNNINNNTSRMSTTSSKFHTQFVVISVVDVVARHQRCRGCRKYYRRRVRVGLARRVVPQSAAASTRVGRRHCNDDEHDHHDHHHHTYTPQQQQRQPGRHVHPAVRVRVGQQRAQPAHGGAQSQRQRRAQHVLALAYSQGASLQIQISHSCSSLPIKDTQSSSSKSPMATTTPTTTPTNLAISTPTEIMQSNNHHHHHHTNNNLEKELLASSLPTLNHSSHYNNNQNNSTPNTSEILNSSSFNLSHSYSAGSYTPTMLNTSMSTSHIPQLNQHFNIHHSHSSTTLQNSHSSPSPSSPATIADLSSSSASLSSSLSISTSSTTSTTTTTTTTSTTPKSRRSSVDTATKEFQQLFKSLVPLDEKVYTYYSCGYQGSVLKYGKLYLTEHYLCFYDNLVFDKTKQRQKVISFSSIKSIEKKSGLAPNGILIKTDERDYRSPECQKIAQILIERGANVNEQNNNGETPLHKAIFNNSVRLLMVYVLLKNNANVNLVNKKGESALHYAVRLGRIDVLKTLITAGADPTLISTAEKKTPLMLAEEPSCLVPEIIDLLRRLEIIINSLVMCQLTQFRMALILEELSQEGSLSRMDDSMMVRIGCYDEDQKKLLLSLKHKRIPSGTTMPAITPGAIDLLKELENMDIKNGRWIIPQHELEYTDKIGSGISGKVQLLRGISTLHQSSPQIVHRDVKSLNFLVTRDWRIKVADFGLSRFNTKSNQMTLNKTRGTSAYCAPEVFQGKEYSEKSDVYSLGVVFWELAFALVNGRYLHPYGEYKKLNEFQIMFQQNQQQQQQFQIMYDQTSLIDTHVHVWQIARGDYGWLTPALERLYRDYSVSDYKAVNMNQYHTHHVDGIILVNAAPTEQETEYLIDVAKNEPLVRGVVGWCDVMGGEKSVAWLKHIRSAKHPSRDGDGSQVLLGVRPMLQDIAQDDWILQKEGAQVLEYLQAQEIVFEALVQPRHLKHLKTLVERYPHLKIVIDHAAKPTISANSPDFSQWSLDMQWFGENAPNVVCKVSGMYNQYKPSSSSSPASATLTSQLSSSPSSSPSSADSANQMILTYIKHLLRCFPSTRLLWGSDFPVHTSEEYQEWLVLTHRAFQHLSPQEQQNIYYDNAIRFYKLSISH
ncbi:hypothetical protein DFA_11248 [Cavenderia fasciculata]|uniref:Protein kinase domain-containing protein n=1 Tax=Cavenderia fasciculata TaxID=261658 RepID=F4QFN4_CACFS|nr:uncharacterized protein DFA_11248 [Cavenderia fasciculata]EGG13487.1 hypothetical protein DFA_11248 [Cavenderia fasciculata]|eukprot:XP_004350191.1 hypothetical protein DFA_11248 [Cavenderia fasciculata]